jgi:hypothetical protein
MGVLEGMAGFVRSPRQRRTITTVIDIRRQLQDAAAGIEMVAQLARHLLDLNVVKPRAVQDLPRHSVTAQPRFLRSRVGQEPLHRELCRNSDP